MSAAGLDFESHQWTILPNERSLMRWPTSSAIRGAGERSPTSMVVRSNAPIHDQSIKGSAYKRLRQFSLFSVTTTTTTMEKMNSPIR